MTTAKDQSQLPLSSLKTETCGPTSSCTQPKNEKVKNAKRTTGSKSGHGDPNCEAKIRDFFENASLSTDFADFAD